MQLRGVFLILRAASNVALRMESVWFWEFLRRRKRLQISQHWMRLRVVMKSFPQSAQILGIINPP